jgi:PAS domain S-box-containing protein
MFSNRQVLIILFVFILTSVMITGVTLFVVYNKDVTNLKNNFTGIVERQKSLVSELKAQGKTDIEIVDFLKNTKNRYYKIGQGGEIVIAKKNSDSVVYLFANGVHFNFKIGNTQHGIPMVMALEGKSGCINSEDYNGIKVYAAYSYLPEVKWGIVAKIPVSEFNESYYEAILISVFLSIILISMGLFFLIRFLKSLFNRHYSEVLQSQITLKEQKEEIEAQNEEYKQINDELQNTRERALENALFNDSLIKTIPFAIDIVDNDGVIQYLSENAIHLVGSGAIGKKCWEVYRDDRTQCDSCPLRSEIVVGKTEVVSTSNVLRGRSVDIYHTGIMYKGKKAVLEIFVDITERIQSQKLTNMLKHSLDIYTDGIYWMDSDNKIVYVNEAGGKAFGCSPEYLLGKTLYDVNPTTTPESLANLWHQLRTKGEFTAETVHRRTDGSDFYVEVRTVYVQYDGKEYYNGYARDITQRKLIEKELINAIKKAEENERFLNISQKIGQIGSYITEFPSGVWRISPEMYEILGIPQEFPQNPDGFMELVHPDWREAFKSYYTNVIHNKLRFDFSYKIVRFNDKAERWVHGFGEFIAESDNDSFKQIGTIQDITERKLAEEELILSEERLRLLVENSADMITILDFEGKFLFYNGPKKYSIQSKDVVGKTLYDFFDFDIADKITQQIKKTIQTGESSKIEFCINFHGNMMWFEDSIYPIIKDNKIISVGVICSDISERKTKEQELLKAKEKAEESDRLKTAFLQNMSHEIRTPMNAIMGFSELLSSNYNNKPKLEHFSNIINQRCNDLLVIIDEILDIARIDSGQLPVNIEKCNISSLFYELKLFFVEHQLKLKKQHINFILQAQCDQSKLYIETDKVKLKQIFINLIGNAFKFTDNGLIEGGCKFENNNLVFYVSDTGIGIPAEKQEIIFERFTQIEPSPNRLYGGNGLGLSIVKGLVGLLGGHIWLESEVGKGTTFYFSFPHKTVQFAESEFESSEKENTEAFLQNKTVLVVEDDTFNAAYIKELLSNTGLIVLYAQTGKEAVEISTSQLLDLVLMDIGLPDISGYEATRQIKLKKPNLKIIAQTAHAAFEDKYKALEAGCSDYISKPLKSQLLLSIINKHLS